MTRARRQLIVGVMMTGLLGAARPVAAADANAPATAGVRSSNPALVSLISQATEQSQTFRVLVDTINASDGIVYVEEGTCGRGGRACFVGVMKAGPNRILKVKVDTRKAGVDLMGSIGHELRHTIEVLENPKVISDAAMFMFYDRIGSRRSESAFETAAATNAGDAVRTEIRNHKRMNSSPRGAR